MAELHTDRAGQHNEFVAHSKELAAAGELKHTTAYDFDFKNVEKQFESFHGVNVKLRCVICDVRVNDARDITVTLLTTHMQIRRSRDNRSTSSPHRAREGDLGVFLQDSTGSERLYSHGGWN